MLKKKKKKRVCTAHNVTHKIALHFWNFLQISILKIKSNHFVFLMAIYVRISSPHFLKVLSSSMLHLL